MSFNFLRPMLLLPGRTLEQGKNTFTVMSYNVLAQTMINRDYYAYSSSASLRWAKRKNNFTNEISQINPDVLCLQECANYNDFWEPALNKMGYKGVIVSRPAGKKDGCAIFYKHELFDQIEIKTISYDDLCDPNGNNKAEMQRHNVACFLALKFKNGENNGGFIIGNTHLFWNWRYSYVRLRQAMMYLATAVRFSDKLHLPFILCGDYNMLPDSTVYEIMTKGKMNEDKFDNFVFFQEDESSKLIPEHEHHELQTAAKKKIEEERVAHVKEYVKRERPLYPLLHSIYSQYSDIVPSPDPSSTQTNGEPPFTNYTEGFKGTLDYLFIRKDDPLLTPLQIMDFPSMEVLNSHTALPNDIYSSDHISIMCQFQLNNNNNNNNSQI